MTRLDSTKARRECFDRWKYAHADGGTVMDCHICLGVIRPSRGEKWEAEHVIPNAFDGTDVRPAHVACHAVKTKKDVRDIAKSKRVHEKHFGIRRPTGFRKTPEGYVYSWSQRRYVKAEAS